MKQPVHMLRQPEDPAATVRLVANPAVLTYAERGTWPILNWVLYTYLVPAAALAKYDEVTIDILVVAEGSTDALVGHIRSLGGTVKYQYRNAPVVAATIPADKLSQVASFAGVTKVEKDTMVYLDDGLAGGKNDGQPLSYLAEDMTGVEVEALDGDSPGTLSVLVPPEEVRADGQLRDHDVRDGRVGAHHGVHARLG